MTHLFEMAHVSIQFGGLTAVNDFSISLYPGELVGLIGPNGAGKTTVFNTMTGFITPAQGDIFWKGRKITRLPAHKVTALGIARTFQNIRIFTDMTVLENVMVSFHYSTTSRFWDAMLRTPRHGREERRIRMEAMRCLEEVGLEHLASEKGGTLPYGQQRKLEIARALAVNPELLLLDEPAAGMNPMETIELAHLIRRIRGDHGTGILLIEHDMKFVMGLCERIKVINYGHSIAEGAPSAVTRNKAVIKAYLGSAGHAASS